MANRNVWKFATSGALAIFLAHAPAAQASAVGAWGLELSDQDQVTRPGDNFYAFQNGAWLARTELGQNQANAYWRDLRIAAGRQIGAMMTELANSEGPQRSHAESLVGRFYRSALDKARIDAAGAAPLAEQLRAIRRAPDRNAFAYLMGQIEGLGTIRQLTVRRSPGRDFFALTIGQDQLEPARNALLISQAGLVLPGPEYYLDPNFADLRAAYRNHVARMLALIGWSNPDAAADQVVALETDIARHAATHEQQRDASAYHHVALRELENLAPDFPWRRFLGGAGIPAHATLAMDFPESIRGIASVYAHASMEALRAKQAFGAAYVDAARLGAPIYQAYRDFATTALAGLQAGPNRDLDVINLVEASIPDAIGEVYAARFSSPRIRSAASEMADRIKRALARRLAQAPWLGPEGRQAAQAKLASLRVLVGYPDHFDQYDGLAVAPDDFYGNVSRAGAYVWREQVAQLGRPVARDEWQLRPFYPQYSYNPTRNTVEVPAALLTPPFFDPDADMAINYGADGTLIASQIASALVGQAANFDGDGRLRQWLPAADADRLAALRQRLAERYSREEPLPGMHINGVLVADEALADLGGMTIAFDAYHEALGGGMPPTLDGLSGDQRFFLGWAQMWRAKFSTAFTRNQLATGSNAPPYMRVNGPIPNIDAWYSAFSVADHERLFLAPSDRVRVW